MPTYIEAGIGAHFTTSADVMTLAARDGELLAAVAAVAGATAECLRNGGKILLAGNGGSAADAQHVAAEFVGRFAFDRRPLAALALTVDTSALTAIGNDYGFESVFSRQVEGLGREGDLFWGISTSGKSPNVVAAFESARRLGLRTVGFCGADPGPMARLCDHVVSVKAGQTALVQQIHIVAAHAICLTVEQALCGSK